MELYRIDREKRRDNPITGIGAEITGGRWNPRGTRAVYCSESRSLAMLEILAHIRHIDLAPKDRILVTLNLPDDLTLTKLRPNELPDGWDAPNYLGSVQAAIRPLIEKFCAIRVPSVIVPKEYNVVLNPLHKDFHRIRILDISPVTFDQRIFGGL